MPANHCPNCDVPISETPEEDGFHPVQMATETDDGPYCEACVFGGSGAEESEGEYELTGDQIVRASKVDMSDDELAAALAADLKAEELRRWMSSNGLTRPRGARKRESAVAAVEQNRDMVAAAVDRLRGITDEGQHYAICSCGFEEHFGDVDMAEEAAEEHKSENPSHFPKAWKNGEERIYG